MVKSFTLSLVALSLFSAYGRDTLDLKGTWKFALDPQGQGVELADTISLPGTTDLAQKGTPNALKPELTKPQLSHLTRKFSYIGPAWYERSVDVPKSWTGKTALELERVLWKSEVWVNGQKVEGYEESLIAPHRFDLTPYLKSGQKNTIRLRIDNSKQHDISGGDMAHAYTDHTQIKWNGVLGKIRLVHDKGLALHGIKTYPNLQENSLAAKVSIFSDKNVVLPVTLTLKDKATSKTIAKETKDVDLSSGENTCEFSFKDLKGIRAWSEFDPALYTFTVTADKEKLSDTLGFRTITRDQKDLKLNGKPLFLRGTLDCCIFPLTGTPPMEEKEWKKWLGTLKKWGINHVRFHSWCPPKAAFDAADKLGLYLQVELPLWQTNISKESTYIDFLRKEGERIFEEYGNHPSFVLFTLGNELQRDFTVLGDLLKSIRKDDGRQLYATSSFSFEGGHGDRPEPADDFLITQWTKQGWVRGQGVFNQEAPSFDKNFNVSTEKITVPIITHEIGQYSVYPDMGEIKKYTGVLEPVNFIAIRNDLEKKGLLPKAKDYLQSSGKLAALLYKEEIERAMKTKGISGFQLLSLSDFTGQGTALVGLINAFGENKGAIAPEEFAQFNAPVVPLAQFPKAAYTSGETFTATLDLANYGDKEIPAGNITYELRDSQGKKMTGGKLDHKTLPVGYNEKLGEINIPLNEVKKADHVTLSVNVQGTPYKNEWSLWVYPAQTRPEFGQVKYTRSWDEARKMLDEGGTVLYNPDFKSIEGIEGKFVPVFWSPVHFPKQAGTMGLLCNPKHPAFVQFPTESHTDWQWWDLVINATTLITNPVQGGEPIVEMIDNFTNNRKLALVYEGSVGKGKLIVSSIDLESNMDKRPAARQLLTSLLSYMNGKAFQPKPIQNFEAFKSMLKADKSDKKSSATDIY